MAAAAAAVRVAEGDDDAVRDWLDGVLKQVETRGRWRSTRTGPSSSVIGMTDRFIGAGIACVERKQRSVVLVSIKAIPNLVWALNYTPVCQCAASESTRVVS